MYHSVNILPHRNILGTKTLSELLSDRENIATDLKSMIDTATDPWGIDVSGRNIDGDTTMISVMLSTIVLNLSKSWQWQ